MTPTLPLRDVLIHELAHLRRGDAGWNLLARLTEALFFFQPLIWLLSRRLEASAEDVCDDYVVQFGGDRSQYARGLLEIAELSTTPVGAAAVAMVSLRSILARRVTRILDPSRSLSTRAGNLLLTLVIAGGLAGATVVGFVGLGSHPPAAAEPQATAADDKKSPEPREPVAETKKVSDESGKNQPQADNELHGTVIGSDGKPVAGAKLYWIRSRVHDLKPEPPRLMATTGEDGRFHFAAPPAVPKDVPASWSYSDRIVITAAGHGFAFTSPDEIRRDMVAPKGLFAALAQAVTGARPGTRLPAAGEPIRGRLLNINGAPVAGAKVRIRWFNGASDVRGAAEAAAGGAENAVWQTRARSLLGIIEPVRLQDVLPSATTDAAGRFELRDIGAERLVQLLVQGEGIEATEIVARNESGDKIVVDAKWRGPGESVTILPNEFLHAVGPSKLVEGRVVDLDTGEPIAGAVVRAFLVQNNRLSSSLGREHFAASTDAEGRYRIIGLPIGKKNKLVAFATGNVPYLPVGHLADTLGSGAATSLDFRLKRGVWAEGRVFDSETDKPFTGEISYYFFRNHELEKLVPGLSDAYVDGLYWTNANGEFRVPVQPGRGILAFRYDGHEVSRAGIDGFPRGFGAEAIAGLKRLGGGTKVFNTSPHTLMALNYERLAEVAPATGQETVRVDMPLFRSPKATVRVEAEGEPVAKFEAYYGWVWQEHDGPDFEIKDLLPGERRKVFVFHRPKNLAGGGVVEYGAKEPLRIELVKAGSVRGRLVDASGEPIDDATLSVDYEKLRSGGNAAIWARRPDLQANPEKIPVDNEGRFRLDGLIPGWTYHAHASAPRRLQGQTVDLIIGSPLAGAQVEAGESKDLGDVVIGADKPESEKNSKKEKSGTTGLSDRPSTKNDAVPQRMHGQVVDAAGQPVAGARLRIYRNYWLSDGGTVGAAPEPQWLADTRGDANGRFSAEFEPLSAAAESQAKSRGFSESIGLFATAEGFGFGLKHVEPAADEQVEPRLPRDSSPIEGRLLDLEGRAVRGARVTVRAAALFGDVPDALNDWLAQVRANGAVKGRVDVSPAGARMVEFDSFLNPFPTMTTNDDGRFTIAGIGADRVAYLEIEGPKIATTWLPVVTRATEPLPLASRVLRFSTQTCYGARCDIVAAPEQPIRGVVRDTDTGEPLQGVEVRLDWNDRFFRETGLTATSDATGRYELSGLAKPLGDAREIELRVIPAAGQPYFRTEFKVPRQPGLDAVQRDLPLRPAVMLRGKVTDRKSGKPVVAAVRYYPFLTNQEARRYVNFDSGVRKIGDDDRYLTDAEGQFLIPAIAGRGVLAVVAEQGDRYTLADCAGTISDLRLKGERQLNVYHLSGLNQDNAYREVNIPASAKEFTLDVELAPLPMTRLLLVNQKGDELPGVETQGLAPMNPFADHWSNTWRAPLPTSSAELFGPEAGETRETLFLHRALNLGAMVRLSSADIGAPTKRIVLRPCGGVRGRIVDAAGKPISGACVDGEVVPSRSESPAGGNMRFDSRAARFAWRLKLNLVRADADGRFELKGVPPGARYMVEAFAEKRDEKWRAVTGEIAPGRTVDVGDLAPAARR